MDKKKKTSKTTPVTVAPKKSSHGKRDFLVVGLGASAGGVKALQHFFSTMPPNTGMAFVVILHLSPSHESNLREILQAQTNMPVSVVDATLKVEPNRVYVIPPNHQLEMVDGVIRPTEPTGERGSRVAVDVFFRTLADAYREKSICIVLSGTGTDGTLGLKAVKEANGFAIVQQPEDAEYDSMPRSAIGTQLADWVLPVSEMPEKLIQFRESSRRLHLTDEDADGKVAREIQADESLREVLTVLRVRTGHDFSNYKTPTLIRRIARHLQIHDLEDIPAYLNFLREKPDEIHSLLKNLLINVTNFFRDPDAWTALVRDVVPNLFAGKRSGDTIRVWSCGCASGEEAYSLAMILAEYAHSLPDQPKIQVFATDVDDDAIAEAREHRYPQSIEADVSPERLKRFFVKEGKYYRIKKELREMVLFAPHNVLRDPPFSKLDLIACRNLLIYLNRDTQERILEIFHFALAANGFLFLGSSETAEAVPHLFATVDKKQRIYTRRPAGQTNQTAPPQMPVAGRWEVRIPEARTGKKSARSFSLGDVHYKLLEQYAPPSVLVNQDFDIQYLSESASRFLRFRGGEPSNNILKLINPDLLPDLRAALFTAQRERKIAEFPNIFSRIDSQELSINIIVQPVEIDNETSDYLLIIFDEDRKIAVQPKGGKKKAPRPSVRDDAMETVVRRLEEELSRTKEYLRATIEQHEVSVEELKASNEELQAINEELRSTTEELETSKEELQSVNEELTTVNHELKEKMDETTRTNSDLQNLMASTDIATIFLDREFRIKRFTTPVEHLFNVTTADVGRPLEHFTHRLDYPNLVKDASEVLKKLSPLEREIRDLDRRVYLTRFVPYRTTDDRIEGVVLNFVDITERKQAEVVVAEDLHDTQILHELAVRSVSDDDIQLLYDKIVEAAVTLTRADAGTVQLYNEKTQQLELLSAKNFPPDMMEYFTSVDVNSKTSCGISLITGERAFTDFDSKKLKDADPALLKHLKIGLRSAQSTPLVSRSGKIIGVFTTHWREHRRLNDREMRFLDLLARQATDLIEQRQAAAALRASEQRLQRIINVPRVGVLTFKMPEGILTNANDAFLEMVGFTRAEFEERTFTWRDFMPPEYEEVSRAVIDQLAETGRGGPYEKEYFRKDGSRIWLRFVGASLGDDTVVEYAVDVSDRKQAEQALQISREQLAIELADTQHLQNISSQMVRENDVNALYTQIVDAAMALMRSDAGSLQILHPESKALRLLTWKGFHPESAAFWDRIEAEHTTSCGAALEKQERVIVTDAETSEMLAGTKDLEHYRLSGIRAVQSTPLVSRGGQIVGMISTHWRDPHEPSERELRLFDLLARQAADLIERTNAEEALRRKEAELESIINETPFMLTRCTRDLRYSFASRAYAEMINLTPEEIVDKPMTQVLDEAGWKTIEPRVARVLRGERVEFEDHVSFRSGVAPFLHVAYIPDTNGHGEIVGWFASMVDISERKRAEEAFRESEERMRIAIEAAQMATWEWDLDKDLVFWNEQHFRLFGMRPRKTPLTPDFFFRRVHPNDRERLNRELREAIRDKTAFDSEFCVIRQDGSTRWMSGYGQVTESSADGKPRRMNGVMFDITERREAEEALRKSEEHLNLILESTKDYAIITFDLKGQITRWNAGAERIFGYTEKEARGSTTHLIFTPEDIAAKVPEKELATTLKNGRAEDERWHIRKDGSRFYASGVMQLLRDSETEGFVKICRDQTVRLEAEQSAVEKEMLRRLVSAQEDERRRIARDIHDHFGQQITALRLKLDAIKKAAAGNPVISAHTGEAEHAAAALDANVDFIAWELRPAALDDLGLRAALANFVTEWSKHTNIKAEFHASGLSRSRLDYESETNLYRIAQEALNNVLKHAGANRVSVLLEKSRSKVSLIIEDDGIGFNPNDKANRRKGIGLVGMIERAKICGGDLEIESAKGKGTTVFARIPVKKEG